MFQRSSLLTIDDYCSVDDSQHLTELVRGKIVEHPFPSCRHGFACTKLIHALASCVDEKDKGWAVAYSGIITQRNPDTLRGADVLYYSWGRLPRDANLNQYPSVPPEIIFEVVDASDSWRDIAEKVAEYLHVGVDVVCIVDPDERVAVVHTPSAPPKTLTADKRWNSPTSCRAFNCRSAICWHNHSQLAARRRRGGAKRFFPASSPPMPPTQCRQRPLHSSLVQ